MTIPAPTSLAKMQDTITAKLAEGGKFATMPMTIGDIEYDRVFLASNASLRDLLAMAAQSYPDNISMVFGEERLSMKEVWSQAMCIATSLITEYNIGPGKRVAIAMRNYPEWCIAYIAIIATGACVVPLNAWWKTKELAYALEDSDVKIVFCDAKRLEALKPCRAEMGLVLVLARETADGADTDFQKLLTKVPSEEMPPVEIDPDSEYCILYTSGSTGDPKGVRLTNRGIISAILSWSFLMETAEELHNTQFTPKSGGSLLALPLFHVTASHTSFLLSFVQGRKIAFLYKWDAKAAIDLIKKEQLTNFSGVPTMLQDLTAAAKPGDLESLIDMVAGGAKRPSQHVKEQADKLPGVMASTGYGLTETNALGTHNSLGDYLARPESAGRAVPPITQIEIWDENGQNLPIGEAGEIMIKSPVNFIGYLNLPEQTAKTLTPDGWFHTGDKGYLDEEGFLFIVDRLKDLIIRGGENISCLEVENAIYKFPGVKEATVFSVPDETLGEIVGAAIYADAAGDAGSDGANALDLAALHATLRADLAHFKVPEIMWLSPQSLPRGGTDKIDKNTARVIALQHPPDFTA